MNSKYFLEIDTLASIEANLEFLDKCMIDIKQKKKQLKKLKKSKIKNQIDLEDSIKDIEKTKDL